MSRAKNIRKANRLGLTLQSYLQYKHGAVPLALAERSPRGIRKIAQSQVNAAYRPALNALNEQESRVKSLQAKRDADNQAFASWVSSRSDQLRADAIAQTNAVRERLAQGQGEFATQLQNIRDTGAARLQQQGVGSTPGGANAAQYDANTAGAQAATQAQVNASQAKIGAGMDLTNATLANNAAVVAAKRGEDYAKSLDEIAKVGDARQRTLFARGSETARAIQNLLNQEVTKAQAIIAAQQFGAKLTNENKQKAKDRGVTKRGQDKTLQGKRETAAQKDRTVNEHGYSNKDWQSFTPEKRRQIIKQDKASGKSKAAGQAHQKAAAKAGTQLSVAHDYLTGVQTPPPGKNNTSPPPRPKFGPGNIKEVLAWLTGIGIPQPVARRAALEAVYPKLKFNKKTAPKTWKQWELYVKSLTGSR